MYLVTVQIILEKQNDTNLFVQKSYLRNSYLESVLEENFNLKNQFRKKNYLILCRLENQFQKTMLIIFSKLIMISLMSN